MSWSETTVAELSSVPSAYVVDVREIDEYTEGHIPGAVNVPLSTLADAFESITPEQTVYVVCQLGGRSARACEFLSNIEMFNETRTFAERPTHPASWHTSGKKSRDHTVLYTCTSRRTRVM